MTNSRHAQPGATNQAPTGQTPSVHRQILSLALPALGSLAAEPLFLLADSAMVGHLGTNQLAGLTIGTAIMSMIVGMCIFLAYTTTAVTARHMGSNNQSAALRAGIDGMWLAGLTGLALAVITYVFSPFFVSLFDATPQVAGFAVTYVRASTPGLIGMLVVLAATGTLRGLLDTKTPFIVASIGAAVNVGATAALIYGANLGVAGSGLGTSLTQTGMALVLMSIVIRGARRVDVSLHPSTSGLMAASLSGAPLVIRTATMHVAFMISIAAATRMGDAELAGYQIVKTLWLLLANIMDATAIASQALIGHALGRANKTHVHTVMKTCLTWGTGSGVAVGVFLAATSFVWPWVFTSDPTVVHVTTMALLVAAIFQPLCGAVFMYDGILIGANDGRYLAVAATINLLVFAPFVWLISAHNLGGASGLATLWAAYGGIYFGMRFLTLYVRARTDKWMKLPA